MLEIYNIVELTIRSLQKRLTDNGMLFIQSTHGYCEEVFCQFNRPLSDSEIDAFFNQLNLHIPYDYRQFLRITDGATLFKHPYYGGGMELFGLKDIHKIYMEYDYINMIPRGWFPIGSDNGDMLFIHSEEYTGRESEYLYWTEMLFVDSANKLEMNFERWLERYIICNGHCFWDWKSETTTNYYSNLKQNLKEYGKKDFLFDFLK